MKFNQRNKLNKTLLIIHFFVTVVVPMGVIFLALDKDSNYLSSKFLAGSFRILFFFIGIPIYFVYARKILLEKFPTKNLMALFMVISIMLPVIYSLIGTYDNLWEQLQLAGLNVYLGLNILFSLGIIYRVFYNTAKGNIPLKLIMTLIIGVLFFYAPAYLLGYSFHLSVDGWSDYEGLAGFFFSILLVIVFHFKLLQKMAREEKI